jgi:hypothetical protein
MVRSFLHLYFHVVLHLVFHLHVQTCFSLFSFSFILLKPFRHHKFHFFSIYDN